MMVSRRTSTLRVAVKENPSNLNFSHNFHILFSLTEAVGVAVRKYKEDVIQSWWSLGSQQETSNYGLKKKRSLPGL